MSAIAELQRRFAQALLHPEAPLSAEFTAALCPGGMSAGRRISVYQANVLGGRIRVLEKLFPVCQRILGAVCFGAMARGCALLQKEPPRDPDAVGELFPGWLQREIVDTDTLAGLDYLPDLARLELARAHAWTAVDPQGFEFDAFGRSLQEHPAERHAFNLAPGTTLLHSDWPVDRIWQVNQSEDAASVDGEAGPFYWVVRRLGDHVVQERLAEPVFHLLRSLQTGNTLGELDAQGVGAEAGELLPRLVQQGFIDGFRVC